MNIEGTYTLQAVAEDVWQCLMDPQVLLHTIPGIERLVQVKNDTYAVSLHVKNAPLIGTYSGTITITEQQYPYHYRLQIEGEGRQSSISGSGTVHLNGHDHYTIIAYTGTLTIGKLGTLLPPPVVKGAAKMLIQQFFTALADQLRASSPAQVSASEEIAGAAVVRQPGGNIVILPPVPSIPPAAQVAAPTTGQRVTHTIVRLLGLGGGDPEQQERWANRLRRIGIASVLLLLVWVGTRLPRRR